ncbi:hypothetical protein BW13_04590 [Bifidobacterium sp. UTCIF-37]|uniref:hypothetical protein n=1 Tax=unclassified Bifidobacterium TaxID=2608897 RepID=UPI001126D1ED|nr:MULTISPECIES: hypothetical protein [unclassified Bifidobacterium]TPF86784.1 hypothetical protein BW13_04590 [Bifidobacterium sp. UTCIF-37]TPF89927.1 hypothetical protein BW11_04590 [Bifidobacterium sp. UTCIF-38]
MARRNESTRRDKGSGGLSRTANGRYRARRELHDALDTLYPGAGFDVTYIGVRRRDGRAMFLHTQGDEPLPDEVNGRGLGDFTDDKENR